MNVREKVKDGYLLLDGGMGTYYSQLKRASGRDCERACLHEPELIRQIHREYLEAGSDAIATNTFAVNRINYCEEPELAGEVITRAFALASEEAAAFDAAVFADIGPISRITEHVDTAAELIWVAEQFIACGAENFLFETQANPEGIAEAAAYIREKKPEAFILVSFAVQADGFSRDGIFAQELIDDMRKAPVDAVGFNCVSGARHMLELIRGLDFEGMQLSVMPNAGYPTVLNNRTFYEGDPIYFADQMKAIRAEGAAILGGCCGTTPEHIRRMKLALDENGGKVQTSRPVRIRPAFAERPLPESIFWEKLERGEKVIAVELDPPEDVALTKFMSGAWELKGAGVDIITIADCPIGRARMDASLLACKLRRELSIDALPHMTCRDRNLNATKALLLGLYAEGIRNVLLVTGDPIPTADRDEVKTVFQFNSRKLASFVTSLGKKQLPSPVHAFGALNLNARNFDQQLKLAKEKLECGIVGFLTQPILTETAFENLKRAREELKGCYILAGIIPVVSARNARFMDSEVNGISVDPAIIERYEGRTRAESEELAVEISLEIAKKAAPYADGYYIITPFRRTALVSRILKELAKQ